MSYWSLTKKFDSSFGSVSYDIFGTRGESVVLVHGTPWSSFNWRNIVMALSQWYTVYCYDLLGYGESEKINGDVSLGVQNKVFSELLDHWGLNSPIVIGHDFGGTTVLRTHLLGKRDFEKIVLVDPVAIAPWGSAFFTHVNQHEKAFRGIPDYIHEAMVSTYVRTAQYKPMDEETMKGIISPWLGMTGQSAFYRQIAQANQKYTDEIEDLYRGIEKPVLIVWGKEDGWIPVDKARKLHAAIPRSQLVTVPDAGHLVMEDQPTLLFSHILKFLQSD